MNDVTPIQLSPLANASFGAQGCYQVAQPIDAWVERLECHPNWLREQMNRYHGFLLLRGLTAICEHPEYLLRLSRLFGAEVENYRHALLPLHMVHPDIPEILLISNAPPCDRQPPPPPQPTRTADGGIPITFPHRRGWHTDQSYRRPPPDTSLFYAVKPAPYDQAQTLYADAIAAYAALPQALKDRIEDLEGLHVKPGTGRSEQAVRDGEAPQPLATHERSQRQPVVRRHPETGTRALYLCEAGQMDWVDGPFLGMQPGPNGDGAALLYELMSHLTQPRFVYVHQWQSGDLVIYDNRSTSHCATWFDAEHVERVMWRTTVRGNPGPEYDGEARSWIPITDSDATPT